MRVTRNTGRISSRNNAVQSSAPGFARRQALAMAVITACGSSAVLAAVPPPTTRPVNWVGTPATPAPYTTPANWDIGIVPTNAANDFARIDNGGIAVVAAGESAESAWLNLGTTFGQSGELRVEGGTLTVGEMRVGGRETLAADHNDWGTSRLPNDGGTGSVVQTGGTVNVTYTHGTIGDPPVNFEPPVQSLYIGDSGLEADNHANGSYTISGAGSALNVGIASNDGIVVGTGVGTQGTFVQQGGDVTSTGTVIVGRRGATGSWTMSGGTLNALGASLEGGLVVGDGDGTGILTSTGTFTQTDGAVNLTAGTSGSLQIGRRSGTGTYLMSGGTLDMTGQMIVGGGPPGASDPALLKGSGTFSLSGSGAVTIGTALNVGFGTTGGSVNGTLNVGGGSITLSAASAVFAVGNGRDTTGTVNHSAGTVTMDTSTSNPVSAGLHLGRGGGNGTYNLSGTGVLDVTRITMESTIPTNAFRIFNVSGGTLDVDVVNFGNGASTGSTRQLNISGGNVNIGTITAGTNGLVHVSGGNVDIGTITMVNGTLHISGGTVAFDAINFSSGSTIRTSTPFTIDAPIAMGNGTFQVDSDTLTVNSPLSFPGGGRNLYKTGAGTLVLNGGWTYSATTPGLSNIFANGGTVNLNTNVNGPANINAAPGATVNVGVTQNMNDVISTGGLVRVAAGADKVLKVNQVLVSAGGRVDLVDNKLISSAAPVGTWTGTAYDGLSGLVDSARGDLGTPMWDGSGLTTSDPRAQQKNLVTIGVAKAGDIKGIADTDTATFAGQTVLGSDAIAMVTYGGDATLDGKINIDDYGRIDANVSQSGAVFGWYNGDFNYDGAINIDDYGIIDGNISNQETAFPTATATAAGAAGAAGVSAVPEPGSLSLLALGALGLIRRRAAARPVGPRR